MRTKTISLIGPILVTLAGSVSAQAADSPSEVEQLREENRRLKESNATLTKSNQELLKYKSAKDTESTSATQTAAAQPPATSAEEESTESSTLPGATALSWLTFEGEEKPWSVNVGTRVWVNSWEGHSYAPVHGGLIDVSSGKNVISGSILSDSNALTKISSRGDEPTPIPYLTARYGRFMLSGSYYSPTAFTFFSDQSTAQATVGTFTASDLASQIDNRPSITTETFRSTKGHREEWEVSVGYMLFRYLALNVGYKHVRFDFTNSKQMITCLDVNNELPFENPCSAAPNNDNDVVSNRDVNVFQGPTLGLSGSLPIGAGFGLYGSYAHGFLGYTLDIKNLVVTQSGPFGQYSDAPFSYTVFRNRDANYDIAELGIAYSLDDSFWEGGFQWAKPAVFAGYRFQRISWDLPPNYYGSELFRTRNLSDITQGFTAGLNFAF